MFKTIQIIVMASLCLNFSAIAQEPIKPPPLKNQALMGKVISALTGETLPGAIIKITNTNQTIPANDKGEFVLTLSNGSYNLFVSSIGYKAKNINIEIPLKRRLVIELDNDDQNLKEVEIVSTGYQTIPKERATGSFTTLNEKLINRNVGINILDRLEGITSGLLVNRGLPSQGDANNAKIAVRGRSTIFANAEPLIVLDGFPYKGTIDQINPADIETINILKDAAAASIWGTRAGNGVIVLTSKRGRKNQRLTVQASSVLTVTNRPNLDYLPQLSSSEYIDMEEYLFSKGAYDSKFNNAYSYISPVVEILQQRRKNIISSADSASKISLLKDHDVRNDLERYASRPAIYQQYGLNIRGGNENNQYYMSGGYDNNLENLVSNSYDRLTLNANNTYSLINDKVLVTGRISFVSSNTNSSSETYSPTHPYDRLADEYGNALAVTSITGLRESYIDTAGNGKLLDWHYRPKDEFNSNSIYNRIQYNINLGIDYKVFKDLHLTANYQYLNEDRSRTTIRSKDSFYTRNLINIYSSIINDDVKRGIPLGDIIQLSQSNLKSKILRFQANYNKVFDRNYELNIIAGYEGGDVRSNGNSFTLYGFDPTMQSNGNNLVNPLFDYPRYYEPGIISRLQTAPGLNAMLIDITQSYYLNASFALKRKYTLSGSARKDESNLFGVKTNQKGVPLWSIGLAWTIDKESFYNVDWLSSLKLRATYGYNGNVDKTVSGYLTVRNFGFRNEWNNIYSEIGNPPNPLLQWEKVKTWNLGLDYTFKDNRVSGSLDVYQKNAIDLIANNPIAMQSGVIQFRGNGASLLSKGIDVVINSKNIIGEFQWSNSFLFNYNTDKVADYKIKQATNLDLVTNNFNNPLQGYPYYAVFSYPSAGLDATGEPQGYLNGILSKDYAQIGTIYDPTQLKYHGPATPKYYGSLINTFKYKNCELSFNIAYKFSFYLKRLNVFSGSDYRGSIADYDKRWQQPGDELTTRVPIFAYPDGLGAGFFRNSEDVIERGDHIRIQDIRLSYQISSNTIRRDLFKNAIFFLYAKNLGILWKRTKYKIDPDYGTGSIPQSFSISTGINLNF